MEEGGRIILHQAASTAFFFLYVQRVFSVGHCFACFSLVFSVRFGWVCIDRIISSTLASRVL